MLSWSFKSPYCKKNIYSTLVKTKKIASAQPLEADEMEQTIYLCIKIIHLFIFTSARTRAVRPTEE
jgi:hypothetical protein